MVYYPVTYSDWINLAEGIKNTVGIDDVETRALVNTHLGRICEEEQDPASAEESKRWLVQKAEELGYGAAREEMRSYQVKMSHYVPLRTQPYPPFLTVYGTGKTEYKTEYVTAKDEREARQKVYVPYGWQIDAVYRR